MSMASACCAVFDLDGTIADTRLDIASAVNAVLRHLNRPELPLSAVVSYVGNGGRKLMERALPDFSSSGIDEAARLFSAGYQQNICCKTELYPGVKNGLEQLKQAGWKIYLLSNKPEELCRPILERLNVASLFDGIMGGGTARPLKPDPAALLEIMSSAGVLPGNCYMVGDHYTDLETGRRAGVHRIYAGWGFGNPKNETWDFYAKTFSDFIQYLSL